MNELEIRTEIQEEHASPLDTQPTPQEQKFCKHCGQRIAKDAVICVHCGRQVEELGTKGKEQPNIVITNTNTNANTNTVHVPGLSGASLPGGLPQARHQFPQRQEPH